MLNKAPYCCTPTNMSSQPDHLGKITLTHSSGNSIVSQKENKTTRRPPQAFFADSPAVDSLLKVTNKLLRCANDCSPLSVLQREPPAGEEEQRDCVEEFELEYKDVSLRQDYQLERV